MQNQLMSKHRSSLIVKTVPY